MASWAALNSRAKRSGGVRMCTCQEVLALSRITSSTDSSKSSILTRNGSSRNRLMPLLMAR